MKPTCSSANSFHFLSGLVAAWMILAGSARTEEAAAPPDRSRTPESHATDLSAPPIALTAPVAPIAPKWAPGTTHYLERNFAQFAPFETVTVMQGKSEIHVFLSSGKLAVDRSAVLKWVGDAASAVSHYYGTFPVPKVTVVLLATGREGVNNGVTYRGQLIQMRFGKATTAQEFDCDWTLTHEMFHTAFPDLNDDHLWMEEGMAVYFEPIARARIGICSDTEVWQGMMDGMRNGMPHAGDEGLDTTHTWGRTYWGGALFWFMADVQIRQQTNNKHSADDALRAILADDGDGTKHWPIQNVLAKADKATETHVLTDLYQKYATKCATSTAADLAALWKSLGVGKDGDAVTFDDTAPLASIRKAMTNAKQNPAP
jgi:hypothetical protein